MRASLDTNVIIHLYKAGLQSVLFDVFDEGVFIYEQIRSVELENHGQDVLEDVDADIESGKISSPQIGQFSSFVSILQFLHHTKNAPCS